MNPHLASPNQCRRTSSGGGQLMPFRFGRFQHTQKEKSLKQKYLKSQSK
jgi:hypothetical protein